MPRTDVDLDAVVFVSRAAFERAVEMGYNAYRNEVASAEGSNEIPPMFEGLDENERNLVTATILGALEALSVVVAQPVADLGEDNV